MKRNGLILVCLAVFCRLAGCGAGVDPPVVAPGGEDDGVDEDVEWAIATLEHPETVNKDEAWELLLSMGADAVDVLVPLLDHEQEYIRQNAAVMLGEIGDPRAVEPLLDRMRKVAGFGPTAEALWAIGEPAMQPLRDALDDESESLRAQAIWLLSRVREDSLLERLPGFLKDESAMVRRVAIQTIVDMRISYGLNEILALMKDEDPLVREVAAGLLSRSDDVVIVEPFLEALKDENPFVRQKAVDTLERFDEPGVFEAILERLTDVDGDVQKHAIHYVSKNMDESHLDRLFELLQHERLDVRLAVLRVLIDRKPDEVGRELAPLLEDPDNGMRSVALKVLPKVWSKDIEAGFIGALDDKMDQIRIGAAKELADRGCTGAVPGLRSLLDDDASKVVIVGAEALIKLDRKKHVARGLIGILEDSNWRVKARARELILKLGGESIPTLLSALSEDRPLKVRQEVADILSHICDRRTVIGLIRFLENKAEEAEEAAAEEEEPDVEDEAVVLAVRKALRTLTGERFLEKEDWKKWWKKNRRGFVPCKKLPDELDES